MWGAQNGWTVESCLTEIGPEHRTFTQAAEGGCFFVGDGGEEDDRLIPGIYNLVTPIHAAFAG